MNDPELVKIESESVTVDRVRQSIYFPAMSEKLPLLVALLKRIDARRTMVFVNTGAWRTSWNSRWSRTASMPRRSRATSRRRSVCACSRISTRGTLRSSSQPTCLARAAHPRREPYRQLRLAAGRRRLPASHRPHGPCGRGRRRISFGCEEYVVSLPEIEGYIGSKIPVETITPDLMPEILPPGRGQLERLQRPHRPGNRGGGGGGHRGGPRRHAGSRR